MLSRALAKVARIAEFIAAMILAAIFLTFLIQIFTRYAPKIAWLAPHPIIASWMQSLVPIGWTVNLISLLWVWLIFVGCSTFVRNKDHVIFDVFFNCLSIRWRCYLGVITSVFLIAIMIYALGPTYDAIFGNRLMDLKKIQTLVMPVTGDKIPIKWLFAPIVLFMVATILRYSHRLYQLFKFGLIEGDAADISASEPKAGRPQAKGDLS